MATKGEEKKRKSTSTAKAGAAQPAEKKRAAKKAPLKDPAGGLTAAGRAAFRAKEGSHLRPGVKGAADTPEKQKRKGSFLRRHFAHPRGPMLKDGEPPRLAQSAHAWGEPVPRTMADAKKLAAKGAKLLEQYHESQGAPPARKKRTARDK